LKPNRICNRNVAAHRWAKHSSQGRQPLTNRELTPTGRHAGQREVRVGDRERSGGVRRSGERPAAGVPRLDAGGVVEAVDRHIVVDAGLAPCRDRRLRTLMHETNVVKRMLASELLPA